MRPGGTPGGLPCFIACRNPATQPRQQPAASAAQFNNRLELSAALRRCLATTNLIENPHGGVRVRTNRVTRWRDGRMVLRWVASAFLATEKNFRRIQGYRDLWMLKAKLENDTLFDNQEEVA